MAKNGSESMFNSIAPIYGLFFGYQQRQFLHALAQVKDRLDLSTCQTVLDVGCGTGALCAVLQTQGLTVTGIEPAGGMLAIARRKLQGLPIDLQRGNVLEGLPFADQSFDVAIASFVAHGLQPGERRTMYREMSRLARYKVIIYDYNQKRAPLTTFLEWLERGDYFRFIHQAESEMRQCKTDLQACFSQVDVLHTTGQATFYVCTPNGR